MEAHCDKSRLAVSVLIEFDVRLHGDKLNLIGCHLVQTYMAIWQIGSVKVQTSDDT